MAFAEYMQEVKIAFEIKMNFFDLCQSRQREILVSRIWRKCSVLLQDRMKGYLFMRR